MKKEALYPFGYGLSYTKFQYNNPSVEVEKDRVEVTVTVKNTGSMDGVETVQVYIKAREEWSPNAQLKKIQKVSLKAGEEKKIKMELTKEAFEVYDQAGNPVISQAYDIYIGGQQPDARSEKLLGEKCIHMEVRECFI